MLGIGRKQVPEPYGLRSSLELLDDRNRLPPVSGSRELLFVGDLGGLYLRSPKFAKSRVKSCVFGLGRAWPRRLCAHPSLFGAKSFRHRQLESSLIRFIII